MLFRSPVPTNLDIEVPMPEPDEDLAGDTPPLPPRIEASLRNVIDYLWKDERRDYHTTDPCARRLHIFRSVNTLRKWLENQESITAPVAGRVFQ